MDWICSLCWCGVWIVRRERRGKIGSRCRARHWTHLTPRDCRSSSSQFRLIGAYHSLDGQCRPAELPLFSLEEPQKGVQGSRAIRALCIVFRVFLVLFSVSPQVSQMGFRPARSVSVSQPFCSRLGRSAPPLRSVASRSPDGTERRLEYSTKCSPVAASLLLSQQTPFTRHVLCIVLCVNRQRATRSNHLRRTPKVPTDPVTPAQI